MPDRLASAGTGGASAGFVFIQARNFHRFYHFFRNWSRPFPIVNARSTESQRIEPYAAICWNSGRDDGIEGEMRLAGGGVITALVGSVLGLFLFYITHAI